MDLRTGRANAMPAETLEATMDHGDIRPAVKEVIEDARRLPRVLADDVTETLEKDGIQKFEASFDEMLEIIQEKSRRLVRR